MFKLKYESNNNEDNDDKLFTPHSHNHYLIKTKDDKTIKTIASLFVYFVNLVSSISFLTLFIIDNINSFEKIGWLPPNETNKLSYWQKNLYIIMGVFSSILLACFMKSTHKLLQNGVNVVCKLNLNVNSTKYCNSSTAKILKEFFSILSSIYMSLITGLNFYTTIDDISKKNSKGIKAIEISLASIIFMVSIFCVHSYFQYSSDKVSNKKLPLSFGLLLTLVSIYAIGNLFIYGNGIKLIGQGIGGFDSELLSLKDDNIRENMFFILSVILIATPLSINIGKIYYNLILKYHQLPFPNQIRGCNCSKLDRCMQYHFSFFNPMMTALSLAILILSLSDNNYFLAISVATVAFLCGLISSFALNKNNENPISNEPMEPFSVVLNDSYRHTKKLISDKSIWYKNKNQSFDGGVSENYDGINTDLNINSSLSNCSVKTVL